MENCGSVGSRRNPRSDPTGADPVLYFSVVAKQQLILHSRVVPAKRPENIRQIVGRYTAERANSDFSGAEAMEIVHLRHETRILLTDRPNPGNETFPIRCEPHTPFIPFQQVHAPFPFQVSNHPADAGLGIGQLFPAAVMLPVSTAASSASSFCRLISMQFPHFIHAKYSFFKS